MHEIGVDPVGDLLSGGEPIQRPEELEHGV
jgi:hypothetical protein